MKRVLQERQGNSDISESDQKVLLDPFFYAVESARFVLWRIRPLELTVSWALTVCFFSPSSESSSSSHPSSGGGSPVRCHR